MKSEDLGADVASVLVDVFAIPRTHMLGAEAMLEALQGLVLYKWTVKTD